MAEHECDKGPMLAEIASDIKGLLTSHARIEQLLLGNGVPGIASTVVEHGTRLDGLDDKMLTQDTIKGLMRRQAALIAGGIGLAATVIGIVQALLPVLKGQ